ncbi:MAG: IS21 family transposase, partial [Actinobacteria bacterium]|nr:IS21 family transposase [Actinomycetota bacterium]
MIDYATFCQIHALHEQKGLKAAQIAEELKLNAKTVEKWIDQSSFVPRKSSKRSSKLDSFKGQIVAMLERHPYSAQQILQQLQQQGYAGGYSILKEFVRLVRPPRKPAFLMLEFAAGECAQVDWGQYGSVPVGSTRRRLSFFVMVLCYSRMIYVEFTLSETMDQFLTCHRHALEFFGGVPQKVMIDNLKVGVVRHPLGEKALCNPRYLDFAAHYGFQPVACNVAKGNEKGRVENGVGYVKKNFLNGLEILSFPPVNPAVIQWRDTVANVRIHGETHEKPVALFEKEKPLLKP